MFIVPPLPPLVKLCWADVIDSFVSVVDVFDVNQSLQSSPQPHSFAHLNQSRGVQLHEDDQGPLENVPWPPGSEKPLLWLVGAVGPNVGGPFYLSFN